MKKLLIGLGIFITLIIVAIIVIPIFFKDDIQRALDKTMDKSLNAKVYYDIDKFGLSLIKNFPDITVSMGDFGVVGVEEFSKDTLASIANFEVTVDIMSVIGGDQIRVKEIVLDQPKITVLVLANGKANYDIAKASEETEEEESIESEDTEGGDMNISIERWAINGGEVVYVDQSSKLFTSLIGLNHEGSGDFTLDVFDLTTSTVIESASFGMEDVEYASNKRIEADVTLDMNLAEMRFAFKDNRIAVNDFAIGAEGYVSMPDEDINMDITFGGQDISIKSILSLIPGVYQEYLDGVTAAGEINFNGAVKGTYNETSMPQVSAGLSVVDGSVSYAEYNIPMEQINIDAKFNYPSADLSETSVNVDRFSMLVDGERVEAYLKLKNLENYTWDFGFEGNADLEKMTKIIPMEGMTLQGRINASLNSKGQMAYIEAEQYDKLPTTGNLNIDGFYFQSEDLPQGFRISKANLTFDPSEIALTQFDAASGNSDFSLKGRVANYLGFALGENEVLSGSLTLNSKLLDVNEFIPETEEVEEPEPEDTTSLEVVRIPENIDFTFKSSIETITYTNLELKDFQGRVLIKDGAIILDKNQFNMLDGTFGLTGSYVTKDLEQPKYDLSFSIKELSIAQAFESFSTVQQYVPIAEKVTGRFSTDFDVNGLLGSDMMPLMDEVNLTGLVEVIQATLDKGDFVNKLQSVAALKTGAKPSSSDKVVSVKDVLIKTEIKDGRLFVEPFEMAVQGQKATFGGNNTLDGQLDYSLLIQDIPTGAVGNALNSAISSFTGGKKLISDKIDLDFGIGGTYDDVKVKLLGTSSSGSQGSGSAKEVFQQQISSKVDEQKAKAEAELAKRKAEAEAKADSIKAAIAAEKKAVEDSIKAAVEAEKKKAKEKAKDKVKDLFKKKGGGE